ncbi:MAG: hypothetical protein NTX97_01050 [Bacteroidetes bacterium]|nr:hypothetical protein [Bacteroidota bacterium]
MKNLHSFVIKPLVLLTFLFILSISGYSQIKQKSAYQIKIDTKQAKSIEGDLVIYKFFILNLPEAGDAESLKNLIAIQDGVKKIEMSPLSKENTSFCVLSVTKSLKLELVQKMLSRVGVESAIIDQVTVPIDQLADYVDGLKKQKKQGK